MTHLDAPLEEQLLNVPVGDGQAVVEINGVANDQLGIMVALWTFGGVAHPRSLPDPK